MVDELIESREAAPADTAKPEVDPARAALVTEWLERVNAAKKRHEKAFKQMAKNMDLAADGASPEWIAAGNHVVPLTNRHINQAVARLYAKNPRGVAKRRKQLLHTVWDGTQESLVAAMAAIQPPTVTDPMTGQEIPAGDPMAFEPDPNAVALLMDVAQVREQERMLDRLAKTMEMLWTHYTSEQAAGFKQSMKALVRRTKVCSVGYVTLAFQRALQKRPEVQAEIDDVTSQLAAMERMIGDAQEGKIEEHSARAEELRLLLQQKQGQTEIVVREGPVFNFPYSDEVIIDPRCRHLKTLAGARWLAYQFDMSCDEVKEVFKKDVKGSYTPHTTSEQRQKDGEDVDKDLVRVYMIEDKKLGQTCAVAVGYPDFLREPAEPEVKIERFFTAFPLVFNEIEHKKRLYPPSDVQLALHSQDEYNRARQGLREHRVQNKPKYVAPKGAFTEGEKDKFGTAESGSVTELNALKPGQDVKTLLQRVEHVGIDPNQYDVEIHFNDMMRSVGSPETAFGGSSGGTATESALAEQHMDTATADHVDDLDDMLTELARATGQLMMQELSKETVVEIVGVGASWPDMKPTRDQIAKDLLLEIKAGSSGRPNQAADLAKLERAMPLLMQTPDINPKPLIARVADLLDIDMEELYAQGTPSITALNAAFGKAQIGTGDPATDPNAQGGAGGNNAPVPAANRPGPQPAFPTGPSGSEIIA